MDPDNDPAAPGSFENTRLADLIRLQECMIALGQASNDQALVEQKKFIHARLESLHPTMISDEEYSSFILLINSIADTRRQTLGI